MIWRCNHTGEGTLSHLEKEKMLDEPLILRPSRRIWFLMASIFACCFAGSVLLIIYSPDPLGVVLGWAGTILFGMFGPITIPHLFPGSNSLTIDSKGFTVCSMWRTQSFLWSDVKTFAVIRHRGGRTSTKFVGIAFDPRSSQLAQSDVLSRLSATQSGCESLLPSDYGVGHEQLADLLNDRLDQFRSGGH